ncbi:NYN domain-containing protein [Marinobacterium jannaschii]|uniref:NYN domain-containing protein n=1 Tax=Marinobacterium jannaschii TaxID=64970 RepID=UPI0004818819|nr:NYN domain-containing protein [Marinobacterium jannaschii]
MKSALFVDFDNIFLSLQSQGSDYAQDFAQNPSKLIDWLERAIPEYSGKEADSRRRILVRKVYLNPKCFGDYSPYFTRSGFDVIDCPPVTNQGKTSADIHMVLDMVDLISHAVDYDEFIIMSADADFRPMLQRLRTFDKRTCLLIAGFASAAYRSCADKVYNLEQFFDEVLLNQQIHPAITSAKPAPAVKDAAEETIEELKDLFTQIDVTEIAGHCAELIKEHVENAAGPLLVGNLATQTSIRDMGLAPDWCGHENFTRFVQSLDLDGLKIENGQIYDPQRHPKPSPVQSEFEDTRSIFRTMYPTLEPLATKLHEILDTPYLLPDDYRFVFQSIADEVNQNGFNLSRVSKTVRDQCRDNNIVIARQTINFILWGYSSFGHYLGSNGEEKAEILARNFLDITLNFGDRAQINLSQDDIELLAQWFGCKA